MDPVQALLSAGLVPGVSLPATSRYATVGSTGYEPPAAPGAQPSPVAHLRRRFVPRPERLAVAHTYTCVQGDRRDSVAATELGDPQLWWRLADANGVIDPAGMTAPAGRVLRVSLAEGVPGG